MAADNGIKKGYKQTEVGVIQNQFVELHDMVDVGSVVQRELPSTRLFRFVSKFLTNSPMSNSTKCETASHILYMQLLNTNTHLEKMGFAWQQIMA